MNGLNYKYRFLLAIIVIMIVGCMFLGSSYALWKVEKVQTNPDVIKTGCIDVEFTDTSTTGINLDKAYPISDDKGLNDAYNNKYTFKVHNNCTIDVDYHLYLNSLKITTSDTVKGQIPDNLIKYAIYKQGDPGVVGGKTLTVDNLNKGKESEKASFKNSASITKSFEIATGSLAASASDSYTLRLWISDQATIAINYQQYKGDLAVIAYAKNS